MSDSDLGDALLRLDAAQLAGVPDVKQQTWRILDRDARRVRRLTLLAVLLWLLAALLVVLVFVTLGLLMPAQAKVWRAIEEGKLKGAAANEAQRATQVA